MALLDTTIPLGCSSSYGRLILVAFMTSYYLRIVNDTRECLLMEFVFVDIHGLIWENGPDGEISQFDFFCTSNVKLFYK